MPEIESFLTYFRPFIPDPESIDTSGLLDKTNHIYYTPDTKSIILQENKHILPSGIDITDLGQVGAFVIYQKALFGEENSRYKLAQSRLLQEFNSILSLTAKSNTNYVLDADNELDFEEILKDQDLSKINCKEGKKAYEYYLGNIVCALNELNKNIQKANTHLNTIAQLTQEQSSQIGYHLNQLEICDYLAKDELDFLTNYAIQCTYDDNGETTTAWRTATMASLYYDSENTDFKTCSQLTGTYNTLQSLREAQVKGIKIDDEGQEQPGDYTVLSSFDSYTILDKLKYISLYYTAALGNDEKRIIFPSDYVEGYPCLPNLPITEEPDRYKEDIKELGGLEVWYTGYLIDKMGAYGAGLTVFTVKTKAILENIAIVTKRIKALKQYAEFITRALQLTNNAQSNKVRLPDAAYLAMTYLCNGPQRDLMELKDTDGNYLKDAKGNEITDSFLVIQCNDNTGDKTNPPHWTNSKRYLLVKANEEGIKTFLGNALNGDNSNGANWEIDKMWAKDTVVTQTREFYFGKLGTNVIYLPSTVSLESFLGESANFKSAPYSVYSKFGIASDDQAYNAFRAEHANDPENITVENYKKYWEDHRSEYNNFSTSYTGNGNMYLIEFANNEEADKYLPKEIRSPYIDLNGLLGYNLAGEDKGEKGDYRQYWRLYNEQSGIITNIFGTWVTQFNTSQQNVMSEVEKFNNDVETLRNKINTLDQTASNFVSKDYTTANNIITKWKK